MTPTVPDDSGGPVDSPVDSLGGELQCRHVAISYRSGKRERFSIRETSYHFFAARDPLNLSTRPPFGLRHSAGRLQPIHDP